ncbi:hypothetical protein J26TS2_00480 [Shouchella clausii]|nr:hypothetical protein J26TS2_00480 [Shouchella clausii]
MYFVYLISNKVNEKLYVGVSKHKGGPDDRFKQHMRALQRGSHHSKEMQEDFNKNMVTSDFFIKYLYCTSNKQRAFDMEQFYIRLHNSKETGYNNNDGGSSNKGYKQSDYAKEVASKIHSKMTGELNPFYGKHHKQETKDLLRKKNAGLNKGIKRSEKTKRKMSLNNGRRKAVSYYGTIYHSLSEVEREIGISRKLVSEYANDPSISDIFFLDNANWSDKCRTTSRKA